MNTIKLFFLSSRYDFSIWIASYYGFVADILRLQKIRAPPEGNQSEYFRFTKIFVIFFSPVEIHVISSHSRFAKTGSGFFSIRVYGAIFENSGS